MKVRFRWIQVWEGDEVAEITDDETIVSAEPLSSGRGSGAWILLAAPELED